MELSCPTCNKDLDQHDAIDKAGEPHDPVPGDVTVCLYCLDVLRFSEDLRLRKMEGSERREVVAYAPVLLTMAAIARARTLHPDDLS